jgi:hypothetical protein
MNAGAGSALSQRALRARSASLVACLVRAASWWRMAAAGAAGAVRDKLSRRMQSCPA